MKITIEIYDFYHEYKPWSGAEPTARIIEEEDKVEEFFDMIEEIYPDGIDMTQLNDILWFDSEWVLDMLGIKDGEEDEE